jgi:hypothetical protein
MSEASIRTIAWREQKREEGYMPVTVWIPARIKNAMANLAFERHQDLGELITDAFQAWTPAKSAGAGGVLTPAQVAALIDRKLAEALASQPSPAVPVPPPHPAPQPAPLPHTPVGMKQCDDPTHAPYDARRKECPQHSRERKRRSRAKKAQERRGEIPA